MRGVDTGVDDRDGHAAHRASPTTPARTTSGRAPTAAAAADRSRPRWPSSFSGRRSRRSGHAAPSGAISIRSQVRGPFAAHDPQVPVRLHGRATNGVRTTGWSAAQSWSARRPSRRRPSRGRWSHRGVAAAFSKVFDVPLRRDAPTTNPATAIAKAARPTRMPIEALRRARLAQLHGLGSAGTSGLRKRAPDGIGPHLRLGA